MLRVGRGRQRRGARPYDPNTLAFVAACTTKPTVARMAVVDALVDAVKSAGVWQKLESLVLFAAATAQAGQVDLRNPSVSWGVSSNPTFEADRGYTGTAGSVGLDGPAVGSLYVQNSAHVGAWIRTNPSTGDDPVAGLYDSSNIAAIQARNAAGNYAAWVNSAASAVVSPGAASNPNTGHHVVSRTGSGTLVLYKNGSQSAADTDASSLAPSGAFYASYTPDQVCAFHAGSGLTAGEVSALYTALATYMTAVGA